MLTLKHLSRTFLGRSDRPRAAAALIEGLEGRRLMSAAPAPLPAVDAAGVLQVAGTRKSDTIVLSLNSADPAAVLVNVSVNGVTTPVPLSAVTGGVRVTGDNGNDTVRVEEGGAGEFTLAVAMFGGNGKDTLVGGSGNDVLDGGNGKDDLDGRGGADTLDGGRGKDRVTGGTGADHFGANDAGREVLDRVAEDTSDASELVDRGHGRGRGHRGGSGGE